MSNELNAKDAVMISRGNSRAEYLKQSAYRKIRRSASKGLYSTTIRLMDESKIDIERLVEDLSKRGYFVHRLTDAGYYYRTELVKVELKIEWR